MNINELSIYWCRGGRGFTCRRTCKHLKSVGTEPRAFAGRLPRPQSGSFRWFRDCSSTCGAGDNAAGRLRLCCGEQVREPSRRRCWSLWPVERGGEGEGEKEEGGGGEESQAEKGRAEGIPEGQAAPPLHARCWPASRSANLLMHISQGAVLDGSQQPRLAGSFGRFQGLTRGCQVGWMWAKTPVYPRKYRIRLKFTLMK